MRVEWDAKKNEINRKKHGISFELAALVFDDERALEILDGEHSTPEEERVRIIGRAKEFLILFVVVTDRVGVTRIISARKATKAEEERYYDNYDDR